MDQRRFLICVTVLAIIVIAHGIGISANHPVNQLTVLNSGEGKYAIVTVNALNIRSEPSTTGTVIAKAIKGERLEVLSEKGEWIKVKIRDSKAGWCLKKYLSIEAEKKDPPAQEEQPKVARHKSETTVENYFIVTATSLNIRSEPSTTGSVIAKAIKGEKVEVLDEKGDWSKVKTRDGKQGWCLKKYLSITSEKIETAVTQKEKQQQTVKPTTKIKEQAKTVELQSRTSSHAAPPSYGVIGGITLSQLSGKNVADNFSSRFGFTAGAMAFFRLNKNLGFQPEILYAMKGAVKKSGASESTVHLDYIDLPLLLRVTLPTGKNLSPYVTIGPVLSYNLQAIVTQNGSKGLVQEISDVKKLDYGVSVGGGAQFFLSNQTFIVAARYYLGLAKIHDAKTDPLDLKNNCLTITLGWLLLQ